MPQPLELVAQAIGADRIDTQPETRGALAEDFSYCEHAIPAAVLAPRTPEDVASIARIAHANATPLQVRGGGLSYTSGYTPEREGTWLLDLRGLDRIVEINETDMYVVVETGVTWKALDEALAPRGLRTPYWGPLSGRYATVGGALSQNSMFHGSALYRTVADSVLGVEVVDGKGEVIRTGSWSHSRCTPFSRNFGPDLTGVFLGDTGALGIKVRASLRLIRRPAHTAFLSYRCESLETLIRAQSDIGRLDIASECFGFDRRYNAGLSQAGASVREGMAAVATAVRKGGLKGVAAAAGMAVAGKDVVQDVPYSMHVTLDAHARAVVEAHEQLVEQVAREHGLTRLPATIPTAVRASPFRPARPGIVNARGEVFVAVHGLFPISAAVAAADATERYLESADDALRAAGVTTRFLCAMTGHEVLIEAIFDWTDSLGAFRESLLEPRDQRELAGREPAFEQRAKVVQARAELRDIFDAHGATHLQIGKYYPYLDTMGPGEKSLLQSVKKALDPAHIVNAGNLGL
jgi:FAD/FMN-containing dehydrogenase